MDLLRKYVMSTAMLRAADGEGAVVDPPAADPAVDPAAAAVIDPPAGDPAPVADPKPPGWALKRISEESEARRVEREARVAAEARATAAEALAARLQAGQDPAAPRPAADPAPAAQTDDARIQAEVNRRELNRDTTAIRDAGVTKYGPSFGEALAVLNAVGATSDEIVMDLIAVDKANAHIILTSLAKDPEKAASLTSMDPRRRIAEFTRMADALKLAPAADPAKSAAPAKAISKAPAPAPALDPSASKVVDGYADEASDEQFTAQFNERMKARATRR